MSTTKDMKESYFVLYIRKASWKKCSLSDMKNFCMPFLKSSPHTPKIKTPIVAPFSFGYHHIVCLYEIIPIFIQLAYKLFLNKK